MLKKLFSSIENKDQFVYIFGIKSLTLSDNQID